MKRLAGPLTIFFLLSHPVPALTQSTAQEWLAEAKKAFQRNDPVATEKLLERTIEIAAQEQNRQVEAEAHDFLGGSLSRRGQYDSAAKHMKAAVDFFDQLGNRSRSAAVKTSLGHNAVAMRNNAEAHRYYQQAMTTYEALNDRRAIALLHYSLTFAFTPDDEVDHIRTGLDIAREVGDRRTEALLLHVWADDDYATDGFNVAFERLNQARSILESLGDRDNLARVLTSIGRLYRVHGHADQAIPFYERSRELQLQTGDVQGVIQSLNATAVALNILGRYSEALVRYEEALKLARETKSPVLMRFMFDGLASANLHLQQYQQAADLLEQSKLTGVYLSSTLELLSRARFHLGQYEAALEAAKDGLQMGGVEEWLRGLHSAKARALWKLGRTTEALADVREVTESIERARRTLIPTDFMKQGFSDTERELTTLAIDFQFDSGQQRQALATAEQARSRAFLDLLASKGLTADSTLPVPTLVTRGGANDLFSPTTATPASDDDLVALARRLDSTVLAYWVGDVSTMVWAVSSQGQINAVRVETGEDTLSGWIGEALHETTQGSNRSAQTVELVSRAGDTILTRRGSSASWRRLYDALIRPVRASLPSNGRGRLTVIPSGPLFRLSFAALMDEKGRYLIEDYSIHYAPGAGVLSHTLQTRNRVKELPGRYVLISNPSGMPATENGKVLSSLPGSDEEVRRISRLLTAGSVFMLRGRDADERSVRNAVVNAKIVHLATHGIVNNDDPFASYLALGRGDDASVDGRMTAEEVYRLNLNADLVVLSACRTGLGRISGDGVAGLARAFFYAGAASVVATLWDVADAPASQLVTDFYQSMGPSLGKDKSEALRSAQLRLLRSLRKGDLRVDTPFGKLPLPEDPILWAGFVLMGEP